MACARIHAFGGTYEAAAPSETDQDVPTGAQSEALAKIEMDIMWLPTMVSRAKPRRRAHAIMGLTIDCDFRVNLCF